MSFHYDRTIVMLDVNRSEWRMMVMVVLPMFVVAVCVAPMVPAIVARQGDAGSHKCHERDNCEYFQKVAFHCALLFPFNLRKLDETGGDWVYIVLRGDFSLAGTEVLFEYFSSTTRFQKSGIVKEAVTVAVFPKTEFNVI